MKTIFQFPKNESQFEKAVKEFDNTVGKYSGGISGCWIYNEGTYGKWFAIQYCGDFWHFTLFVKNGPNIFEKFYPETYQELVDFILAKIN